MPFEFTKMQYALFVAAVLFLVFFLWPTRTPIPAGLTQETAIAQARACVAAGDTAVLFYDRCPALAAFDPDLVYEQRPRCMQEFEVLRAFSSDRVSAEADRQAAVAGAIIDDTAARTRFEDRIRAQSESSSQSAGDLWCRLHGQVSLEESPIGSALRHIAAGLEAESKN